MSYRKEDFELASLSIGINPREIQQAATNILAPIIQAQAAKSVAGQAKAAEWFGTDGLIPEAGEALIGEAGHLKIKLVVEPDGGYHGEVLEHDPVNGIAVTGARLANEQ